MKNGEILKIMEFEKVKSFYNPGDIKKQIITSGFYNPINILRWNLGWIDEKTQKKNYMKMFTCTQM